jgi:hypothetical protein
MNSERSAGTDSGFCRLYRLYICRLYSCIDVSMRPNEGTRRTAAVPTLLDDDVKILVLLSPPSIKSFGTGFRRIRGGRARQRASGTTMIPQACLQPPQPKREKDRLDRDPIRLNPITIQSLRF